MAMTKTQLWYTRCGSQVRGPFHVGLIRRYLILGRLSGDDEVSVDQQTWTRIALIPQFAVEELYPDLEDPLARERLLAAKRWADERRGGERRGTGQGGPLEPDRRAGQDRRGQESDQTSSPRVARAERPVAASPRSQNTLGLIAVVMIGAAFVALIFTLKPPGSAKGPDCSAAPAPGVNWANCHLQGRRLRGMDLHGANLHNADLSGMDLAGSNLAGADLAFAKLPMADLRGTDLSSAHLKGTNLSEADLEDADLRGADLSYATLRRASLTGAKLAGATLINAIWIDSTVCGPGSVGGCRPETAARR